jgi:hypothetical protein
MPTTSKMSLSCDVENIFSEFEDPERQDLIGRVLNKLELADGDCGTNSAGNPIPALVRR